MGYAADDQFVVDFGAGVETEGVEGAAVAPPLSVAGAFVSDFVSDFGSAFPSGLLSTFESELLPDELPLAA